MATQTQSRFEVLGVQIDAVSLASATHRIVEAASGDFGGQFVCCCDAHSISWAHQSPGHREALNRALLATPDGMPLVWLGRHAGHREVTRVYGPDLLLSVCAATAGRPYSHFFYGAGAGTAAELAGRLQQRFPGLQVAGWQSPPYRPLEPDEVDELYARVRELRPHFFWVSLGTPRQEAFMLEHAGKLSAGVLLGVGAAFDFLTGRVRQAPRWIQRSGLEWLWRLSREPRRLGPRYLRTAPWFAWNVARQVVRGRRAAG